MLDTVVRREKDYSTLWSLNKTDYNNKSREN
jgi:hypothetical protein